MSTTNKQIWYLGDDSVDLDYLKSVVGEQNIVSMMRVEEAPSKPAALLVIDVDGVADWEHQLSGVDIGPAKVALVSSSPMSQVFIRSMYGERPRRWYLGRLIPGTLPDSFVRALGACLHGENEFLKLEMSDLRNKLLILEESRESSAENELSWRRQIEAASEKFSALQVENERLKIEKASDEEELKRTKDTLATTERSLLDSREAGDHARKIVTDVQDELDSLRSDKANLSEALTLKEQEGAEQALLLEDNQAAVERLRGLNSDLSNKLEVSVAELASVNELLAEESEQRAAAVAAELAAGIRAEEAEEQRLIASQAQKSAEAERDKANEARSVAQASSEKSNEEMLEAKAAAKESQRESAASAAAASKAKEDADKAVGEAEARTLEAYGLLADRTEALEDECLLAANLGEENSSLKKEMAKRQQQLETIEAELTSSLSKAREMEAKLEVALVEAQDSADKAAVSYEKAQASEEAARTSLEKATAALESEARSIAYAAESSNQATAAKEAQSLAEEKAREALLKLDEATLSQQELSAELDLQRASTIAKGLECDELTIQINKVSEELATTVSANEERFSERELFFEQTKESMQAEKDHALLAAQKELEESLAKANTEAAEKLSDQIAVHESALTALKGMHEKSILEKDTVYEANEKRHKADVAELESRHASELSLLREKSSTQKRLGDEAEAKRVEADSLREIAVSKADIATKERDDAISLAESASQRADIAEKRAEEAHGLADAAAASKAEALSNLEELKERTEALTMKLRAEIDDACGQNDLHIKNIEALKGEMLANDAKLALISTERDRLATEKQQLTEAALKSSEELEYMQHENREISTKLVALESIRAQHLSELEELRGDLDIEEVARKEATSRAEAALSDLTRIESTSNLQIESLKEDITRLRGEMESQRIAGKQALSDMEQKLVEAQAQIEQVESSNTEAIMEIAKLRSRQTKPQHVVQPPTRAGGGRVAPVAIDSDIAEVRPMGANDADARARRLEEELAEANSRLRATSSGVVWSARREPETKEGFIGRLKGTIRRNGDS